jgi:hypothetical protein
VVVAEVKIGYPQSKQRRFYANIIPKMGPDDAQANSQKVGDATYFTGEYECYCCDDMPDECRPCQGDALRHYLKGLQKKGRLSEAFRDPKCAAGDIKESILFMCRGKRLPILQLVVSTSYICAALTDSLSRTLPPWGRLDPWPNVGYLISTKWALPQSLRGWVGAVIMLLVLSVVLWKVASMLSDRMLESGTFTVAVLAAILPAILACYSTARSNTGPDKHKNE